tara:strand:- start:69940 stop:70689 length:750 start_codon:yes stop_codon:yes gene_type:complete
MITVKIESNIQINNYEVLTPIIKEHIDSKLGSKTEIILPVSDLKIRNEEVKHKNHLYGLAYDQVGFIPFVYTVSSGELKINLEDVKISEEHSYLYAFELSDKGKCVFSLKENFLPLLECNLIKAPVKNSKLLLQELESKGKKVAVNVKKPSNTLISILIGIGTAIGVFFLLSFLYSLGETTYQNGNNGGQVFFILIPLGLMYEFINDTILEDILFVGIPLLTLFGKIFSSLSTRKKSTQFINELMKYKS